MKKILTILLLTLCSAFALKSQAQTRPDTLWYRYDNRFTPNKMWEMSAFDTIEFRKSSMVMRKPNGQSGLKSITYPSKTTETGYYTFTNPGRYLFKPSSMNCDFTKSTSQWCFERSAESEHFVVFWEKGVNFDKNYILNRAEKAWDVYVNQLGFLIPGKSKGTDNYKIVMRMYNSSDWIASGSGEDRAVGTLNLSPSAYQARGGHTLAHEVGHTFQYLTNVDNGANSTHGFDWGLGDGGAGGNGFWEDCANWQAYKVYPEDQFNGEYYDGYMARCHQNLMHENSRYHNCFYQDYLCEKFGQDFIGRLWRESIRPEDPVDAIKRMQNLDEKGFAELMYDCFAHMCTWDIEGVRSYAKHRIGGHPYCLEAKTIDGEDWYQVSPDRCPQNYGYNITQIKVPAEGQEIKIELKSCVGEAGYRAINKARAGWRWGVVCLMSDGTTQYGEMQSGEGTASYTVPQGAQRMWVVVMGAPTQWWHHLWDDDTSNDEQWPYRLKFEGTHPSAVTRIYTAEDFPEDYERRDTTVVINCTLPYNATGYTSINVQYDTDAICEALGLTTAQLKAVKVGSSSTNPCFIAMNSNKTTLTYNTTTSTSSSTVFGHWFNAYGNVCNYDSSAMIYAEVTPSNFVCKLGQYPGRLTRGKTYVIRQGVRYKSGTKWYKAIMEVHVDII